MPTLREGFAAGLRNFPDAAVEMRDDFAIGTLLGIEAVLTYRDGEATRKRWVRLLYQGSTQVRLIAQGASVTEYDYWLPMLTQAMRTFQFADWWAEVTGIEWLPSLDAPLDEEENCIGGSAGFPACATTQADQSSSPVAESASLRAALAVGAA